MGKLTSQQVLYMDTGGPKTCSTCMMFLRKHQECAIHGADPFHQMAKQQKLPEGQLVCYLYVPGDPMDDGDAHAYVTPEQSGLGFGGTSCGSCEWGNGREYCAHPCIEPFEISNEGGCCNGWYAIAVNHRAETMKRVLEKS